MPAVCQVMLLVLGYNGHCRLPGIWSSKQADVDRIRAQAF